MNQSTKKETRICRTSTMNHLMIKTSRTNNIVADRSLIVTMINLRLVLVLATNSRFVLRKNASYVKKSIIDQRITQIRKLITRKSVLRIIISNEKHVKNFNVV